jgi:hypothetical protein
VAGSPTELRSKCRCFTEALIDRLAGIATHPASKDTDAIRAAEILLDRGWGKPVQEIEAGEALSEVLKAIKVTFGS